MRNRLSDTNITKALGDSQLKCDQSYYDTENTNFNITTPICTNWTQEILQSILQNTLNSNPK